MPSTPTNSHRAKANRTRAGRAHAFTLIELLTVMFIITVLIGILIPALNGARRTAKKSTTKGLIRTIEIGLDSFKNDNERDFPQTNGFPPSFSHPPIPGYTFDPIMGEFPFVQQQPPVVNGAHWLPAMLMGVDGEGYVSRRSIPKKGTIRKEPWKWYTQDPFGSGEKQLERKPLYMDPNKTPTVRTEDIEGRPNMNLFPDWDVMKHLPVIIDAFEQPVLYYASNRGGTPRNIVADERDPDNSYTGGIQLEGPPYYVHDDNHGFTGDEVEPGFDFGARAHDIAVAGDALDADALSDPTDAIAAKTFAHFILDRKQLRDMQADRAAGKQIPAKTPLRVANPKRFLLISAGADGKYGTMDDVTNFPLTTEPQ